MAHWEVLECVDCKGWESNRGMLWIAAQVQKMVLLSLCKRDWSDPAYCAQVRGSSGENFIQQYQGVGLSVRLCSPTIDKFNDEWELCKGLYAEQLIYRFRV